MHDLACAALFVTAGQLSDVTLCLNCNSRYHITFAGAQVPPWFSFCLIALLVGDLLIPHTHTYRGHAPLSFGGTENVKESAMALP